MRKKWLISIFCSFLFLYFFSHALVFHGIMHYLTYVSEKEFGAYLQYESLSGSFGDLQLQKVYLSDSKVDDQRSLQLYAPEISIRYRFNIFSRVLDVDLYLSHPELFFSKNKDLKNKIKSYESEGFITVRPHFKIEEGLLIHENENKDKVEYVVSLEGKLKKKEKLSITLKDASQQFEQLKFDYEKNNASGIKFAANCNQLDLGNLGLFIKKLNFFQNNWDLKRGIAHGNIKIQREKGKGHKTLGAVSIKGLEFENKSTNTKTFIDNLSLDLAQQTINGKKSTGKIFLMGTSYVEMLLQDGSKWLLEDLAGECLILKHGQLDLQLTGTSKNNGISFKTNLVGDVRILDGLQTSVNLQLNTSHIEGNKSRINVSLDHIGPLWNCAHLELTDITAKEIEFYRSGLFNYLGFQDMPKIKKGILNSLGKVHFKGFEIQTVEFDQIKVEDLVVISNKLNLYGQSKNITGRISVDFLEKKLFEGIDAEMNLSEGIIHFYGYDKELWKLSDIHTNINCKKGIIEKSLAKGNFAGLIGEIEIDWFSKAEIVKLSFAGNPLSVEAYLPEKIKKGLHKTFLGDHLFFTAGISRQEKGLDINALTEVHHLNEIEKISFGFKIEKLNQSNNCAVDWKLLGKEALAFAVPNIEESVLNQYCNLNSKNRSGYILKDGWVHANDLPLDRYIQPFLQISNNAASTETIMLSGIGSVYGSFDQKGVAIFYSVEDFVFEGDKYTVSIPKIVPSTSQSTDLKNQAFHIFVFENGQHYGSMPINDASYLEKNSGLLFYGIDTRLNFENEKIHANDVAMNCCNIRLAGELDILRSKHTFDSMDVGIRINSMKAGLKDLASVGKYFSEDLTFADYSLDGRFELSEEARINIKICPEALSFETKMKAVLTEGQFKLPNAGIAVQDLRLNIDYDQEKNTFILSDLEGVLTNKSDNNVEKIFLNSEKIFFSDFQHLTSAFDLKMANENKEFVRLVGNTSQENNLLTVTLENTVSHFESIFFDYFQFKLQNGYQCKDFKCAFKLPLHELYHDIKVDQPFFSYFLSGACNQMVNRVEKMEGNLDVKIVYDDINEKLLCTSVGDDLHIGSYDLNKFFFEGFIKDKTCVIDRLICDEISVSAEVLKEFENWKINFLGIKYGKSLLVGAEGDYDAKESLLRAKINLLEIQLDHLNEWASLANFIESNNPKGVVRGNGSLTCSIKDQSIVDYDSIFNFNAKNFVFRDFIFKEIKNFSCLFQKSSGITLRNIVAEMHPPNNVKNKIKCSVEKINCLVSKDSYSIESLNLTIPYYHLDWLSSSIAKKFPAFSTDSKDILRSLINHGQLNPSFNCDISSNQYVIKMSLPNDSYQFKGETFPLTNFSLIAKNDELTVSTGYKFQQKNVWLTLHAKTAEYPSGTLLITEQPPAFKIGVNPSILVNWDKHPIHGLNIKDIKGKFAGLTMNLTKDEYKGVNENYCNLTGEVLVNVPEGLLFFDPSFMQSLKQNRLFGSFNFKGQFIIAKSSHLKSQFHGDLQANNWAFKGYYWNNLNSHLNYYGNKVDFTDLTVSDTACSMIVPNLHFEEDEVGTWLFSTPKIYVKDLKPTKLKEIEQQSIAKQSSLILNYIQIENFFGKLSNNATWKGVGKLKFANPPKTNLQNTIFSLPHELITRIGLNPAVLTPVTGSIHFNIYDSKFNFTKFEDIYSETKGSKFYLSENTTPSYLDFNGNLNLKVRMKQYNLLFKITELMTVSIKGTLNNPQYSLRKEKNSRKKI